MHLAIDAVGNKSGGGASVLLEFLDHACKCDKIGQITVFASPTALRDFSLDIHSKIKVVEVPSAESDLGRTVWALGGLQRRVRDVGCDIFLGLNGIGYDGQRAFLGAIALARPRACPTVTFIQQPVPFSQETMVRLPTVRRMRMSVIRWAMKKASRDAEHVFVQTTTMKRDVATAYGLPLERVTAFLPSAPKLPQSTRPSRRLDGMRDRSVARTILYVGSNEKHKNLEIVERGLALFAEESRPRWFVTLPPQAEPCRPGGAIPLGHLNRNELWEAYGLADVVVMPSLTESVGLPMLEAMRFGTPVLAADRPFAHEVCETAAHFFDPLSPRDFVEKLSQVLENRELRTQLIGAGRALIVRRDEASAYQGMLNKLIEIAGDNGRQESSRSRMLSAGLGARKITTPRLICSNCIMDESDPGISFDANGRCHHCGNFHENILPHWHTDETGAAELAPLVEKIKRDGKDRDHDCLIGISGGLDSSFLTYVAKEKLGLRPMLFHVDAGWDNRLAVSNIERLVEGLKLDLYTEVIDWEEMRDLQVAFLRAQVADQDIPQDLAFFSALYNYAAKNGHKYILTGGNYSTECVREPLEWGGYFATDMRFVNDVHSQFGRRPLRSFPTADIFRYKLYYRYIKGVQMLKVLNNVPYIKADAEKTLRDRLGWERFQHKHHESRFTRFYEDFWMPRKFGYEKRRAHFSSLILTGQMKREDALRRIASPEMDDETTAQEFAYVAKKLELEEAELWNIFEGPNKSFRDYKNNMRLISIGTDILRMLGMERRRFDSAGPKRSVRSS